MTRHTIESLMEFEWTPTFRQDADGGWVVTVAHLRDFKLYSESREELEAEWRDALNSHLQAYVACGKWPPLPLISLRADYPGVPAPQHFRVDEQMQQVA